MGDLLVPEKEGRGTVLSSRIVGDKFKLDRNTQDERNRDDRFFVQAGVAEPGVRANGVFSGEKVIATIAAQAPFSLTDDRDGVYARPVDVFRMRFKEAVALETSGRDALAHEMLKSAGEGVIASAGITHTALNNTIALACGRGGLGSVIERGLTAFGSVKAMINHQPSNPLTDEVAGRSGATPVTSEPSDSRSDGSAAAAANGDATSAFPINASEEAEDSAGLEPAEATLETKAAAEDEEAESVAVTKEDDEGTVTVGTHAADAAANVDSDPDTTVEASTAAAAMVANVPGATEEVGVPASAAAVNDGEGVSRKSFKHGLPSHPPARSKLRKQDQDDSAPAAVTAHAYGTRSGSSRKRPQSHM